MRSAQLFTLLVLVLSLIVLSACGGKPTTSATSGTSESNDQMARPEPPDDYANRSNPLSSDVNAVSEGEGLFQANCSSCHGPKGQGDGPAAGGLEPKPQNLAKNQASLSDAYLYWRISEGGLIEPFNSVMPSWKGILIEEQIWQIITYLRTLQG